MVREQLHRSLNGNVSEHVLEYERYLYCGVRERHRKHRATLRASTWTTSTSGDIKNPTTRSRNICLPVMVARRSFNCRNRTVAVGRNDGRILWVRNIFLSFCFAAASWLRRLCAVVDHRAGPDDRRREKPARARAVPLRYHGCKDCHTIGQEGKLGFTNKGKERAEGFEGCISTLKAMSIIAKVPEDQRAQRRGQRSELVAVTSHRARWATWRSWRICI